MLEYPRFSSDRIKLDTVGKQTCHRFARGMDVSPCDLSARNQQNDLPVIRWTFFQIHCGGENGIVQTRLTSPGCCWCSASAQPE